MVFSSFEFLFRFLPFFLLIYYVTPQKWKNAVLFAGSILFYTAGEAEYVVLLLASVVINYVFGRLMYRDTYEGRGKKQLILLIVALCYDFGVLFLFKYSGFMDKLPLGISFYTFQIAAYIIDVYRGRVPVEKSFIRLGTYVTMFPQLIAGPIINYSEVRMALCSRTVTFEQFESGLKILILGLGAKVIVADRIGLLWNNIQVILSNNLAYVADAAFSSIGNMSVLLAWLGAIAYTLQIYFDFSGYSLMALGLGRMLGFEFPKNFKHPYISRSVSEFWRRWHITLGRWFREYVYIPLGGNRKGKARTIFNLFVVWSLTAVWHGAEGHFLIWGASLLLLLALEKAFLLQFLKKSKILSHVYLVLVVPLTWMAFAIADVGQLGVYYARMFPFFGVGETVRQMDFLQYLKDYGPLFLMGIVFSTPYPTALYKVFEKKWLGSLAVIVVLGLSLYYMAVSTNNPFLYFNF